MILDRDQPLVIIIDDIHSAEQTFLELLDHLTEAVEDAPILVLCSARHQLMERHAEWSEVHASALIVLHEFGHFAMAKLTGMRVERFALFFPPLLFKVRRGETHHSFQRRWVSHRGSVRNGP